MSSQFITNQDRLLSEVISGILPKSSTIDFLVGYFYFSGFDQIYHQIGDKYTRILVGMEVDTIVKKQVREIDTFISKHKSRGEAKEHFFESFRSVFNDTDEFDSSDKITSFRLFCQKIMDGTLEIKKTEQPCHAKMYLFHYSESINEGGEQPGTVITGSSNLTRSGLRDRMEINARFTDKQSFKDGETIFNTLWKDAITIVDKDSFDEFNNKVIEHIWYEKLYSPYLIYIRVLEELFSTPSKENILTPFDLTNGKYLNLKYQTDAVQMALRSIETHNGVIIADVVGLGKSIIASSVARNLKLRAIVVAPPHLKTQWEEYRDEFGFTATVFSSGTIDSALSHYRSLVNSGEQFLIIIDEAHKYRNEYTQDYAQLHELCSSNKVMLLTATPFNNRPEDIYSMIKLFQIPSKSTLKTVQNLGIAFKELIEKYKVLTKKQRDGKIKPLAVQEEANQIAKRIRSIISPLVVRRSRLDLEEIPQYKEDIELQGIKPVIPNDPELLEYELGDLEGLYIETLNQIAVLEEVKEEAKESADETHYFKAARYQPTAYVKKGEKAALEKELEEKTGIKYNLLIGTQENLAWFMRRLLVRRFESSVYSFMQSLNYMISSSEQILLWVKKRGKVPVYKKGYLPAVEDFYLNTSDRIETELSEKFDKYTERGFFEIDIKYINDNFVKEVQADIDLLRSIRTKWFGVPKMVPNAKSKKEEEVYTITRDPKLESFKKLLEQFERDDPKRKIIVFSEFADTVDYLGRELSSTNLAVMKYTSADATTKNKEIIRNNFDAGRPIELQKNEIQILIATDAISEGYNLHRAGAIFNYDIPYNPTRVIQRIGRINRINKKMFNELYIFNYFPTDVGESETRTKEISTLKMAMIHAIMGEDTKALTKHEELKSYFAERYRVEMMASESTSWDTNYRNLLHSLKGTEEWKQAIAIPRKTRIGRKADKPASGVLIFGKKGNDFVFKIGNNPLAAPTALSTEEALLLFEASRSEEPFEVTSHFESLYQQVKSSLFNSDSEEKKEKHRKEAIDKIKVIQQSKVISNDYLKDLLSVIKYDAIPGYLLRHIKQLASKEYSSLPSNIEHSYLIRQLSTIGKVDEGEETLILTEELQ